MVVPNEPQIDIPPVDAAVAEYVLGFNPGEEAQYKGPPPLENCNRARQDQFACLLDEILSAASPEPQPRQEHPTHCLPDSPITPSYPATNLPKSMDVLGKSLLEGLKTSAFDRSRPDTHSSVGSSFENETFSTVGLGDVVFSAPTTTYSQPPLLLTSQGGARSQGRQAAVEQSSPVWDYHLSPKNARSLSSKSRRKARPSPSRFCHLCSRTQPLVRAICSNIEIGKCKKSVCRACFAEHPEWSWEEATAPNSKWKCPHCTSQCANIAKARCAIYKRVNQKRRMARIAKKAMDSNEDKTEICEQDVSDSFSSLFTPSSVPNANALF